MAARVIAFTVDGVAYHARQIDLQIQLDMLARMAPLVASGFIELVAFIRALQEAKIEIKSILDIPTEQAIALAGPVMRELAKMPDADRRFITRNCLTVCQRKGPDDKGFADVWNQEAGQAMFEDLQTDLATLLRVVAGVLEGTFGNFIRGGILTMFVGVRPQTLT